MTNKEKDFYDVYYDDIHKTELYLLNQIHSVFKPLNQQSETKMIEYITSRIKTPESTKNKLLLDGLEPTAKNAVEKLCDVVGIRLVVHFIGDIYVIRNILVNSGLFKVIKEKDYIRNVKKSGYRGYHIIVETEVDGFMIRSEIQLRTIAMDCWASLEHQLRYKKIVKNMDLIDIELKKCSDDLMSADIAMEQIFELIKQSAAPQINIDTFYEEAMDCASKTKE